MLRGRNGFSIVLFCLLIVLPAAVNGGEPLYLDSNQAIDRRVEDLLSRMTLEEKLGQMNIPCAYKPELGGRIARSDIVKYDEGIDFKLLKDFKKKLD
ncbi:hypothetical protein KAS50_09060, partial [bacterium]|nr:hypothetical protein [bacterium]